MVPKGDFTLETQFYLSLQFGSNISEFAPPLSKFTMKLNSNNTACAKGWQSLSTTEHFSRIMVYIEETFGTRCVWLLKSKWLINNVLLCILLDFLRVK